MKPDKGRMIINCCLDASIKNKLEDAAKRNKVSNDFMVDYIVQLFEFSFDDWLYFNVDIYKEDNALTKLAKVIQQYKPKYFIGFQIEYNTVKRLNVLREKYKVTRSMALKHIISKYLQDNKL